MMVLITYDVATTTPLGRKRLRQVAKKCQDFGQRVQNSVFECIVNSTQFIQLKHELTNLIDVNEDSLRFYQIGNNYANKIQHVGVKPSLDIQGPLFF